MRYAVISDIHANLEAFQAVLDDAGDIDRLWCLGDVIGYGPDPNDCTALLREYEHICVAGNHDLAGIGKADTYTFNSDAKRAIEWTTSVLGASAREYLARLPLVLTMDNRFTVVHGSPREPAWEYIVGVAEAKAAFHDTDTEVTLVGHTHVPMVFRELGAGAGVKGAPPAEDEAVQLNGRRLILNPGSVGQPRDGDERASYILLDLEQQVARYRRVPYRITKVQEKMQKAGLPERLIARLTYGR